MLLPLASTPGAKLPIFAQWALTGFGRFCLVGVDVAMGMTPDALPM